MVVRSLTSLPVAVQKFSGEGAVMLSVILGHRVLLDGDNLSLDGVIIDLRQGHSITRFAVIFPVLSLVSAKPANIFLFLILSANILL